MSIKILNLRVYRGVIPVVLLAAALRFLLLGIKPPHFDEGVNGWFVDEMTRTGFYHYDPKNYHGPLHFYLLFFFQTLLGRNVWALRLPVAAIGVLAVFLVTQFDRFFNRRTCLLAALGLAVAPAAVFYGRYAIHETEMLFFTVLTAWGLLGLWRDGTRRFLWAAGLGMTGMILTKETYIIHAAVFILGAFALRLLECVSPSEPLPVARRLWTGRDMAGVLAVCAGLILFFYSGGLLDFGSLRGLYETYAAWFQTGTQGHGHEKPYYYWLALMSRYEWIALAGLAGVVRLLFPGASRQLRYLAICGGGTLAAYSIVSYKTPWCIIAIIWPFFFVFGSLVDEGVRRLGGALCAPLAVVVFAASTAQTAVLNFFQYTDEGEEYVYVQTLPDVFKLTGPLLKLAEQDPANYNLAGHIMLASYHPLPWMLGDFTAIGYYGEENTPAVMDAAFLLVDESRTGEVERALRRRYFKTPLKLRGGQDPAVLYLDEEKFRALFPGRTAEFKPPEAGGAQP